ncbi:MAG: serpin family protein [Planctomycetaceae bacterium]
MQIQTSGPSWVRVLLLGTVAAVVARANDIPTARQVKTAVVKNNNQFAIELHRTLTKAAPQQNSVCSPNSVSNALGMLYVGADGRTRKEMAATLHIRVSNNDLGRLLNLSSPTRKRPTYRLGITVADNDQGGVKVTHVADGGPAAKFGIKPGDILLAIDGRPLRSQVDFQSAIDYSTGCIDVKRRGGQTQRVTDITVTMIADQSQPNPSQNKNLDYLRIANAIWMDRGFPVTPEYSNLLASTFGAKATSVDFDNPVTATARINKWVADETRGSIDNLLSATDVDKTTQLVVTNAIDFQGTWAKTFDPERTRAKPFTTAKGETISVPTMVTSQALRHFNAAEFQAVELPFRDSTLALLILLPRQEQGLAAIEQGLSADVLDKVVGNLKSTQVVLTLPRFEITSDSALEDAMQAMGMTSAFNSNAADFSGISGTKGLYLSKVVHKARIKVDEEGATASAASAAVGVARGPFSVPFQANHPFLFVLRDTITDSIIFIGRTTHP